jgi:hypothetical protein
MTQSGGKYTEEQKRLRDQIEKKYGKSPEEVREEKEKRILDAIELREPDRVPVSFRMTYFPGKYLGLPKKTAYYDPATWKKAALQTMVDFDPDMCQNYAGMSSGDVMDILKPTTTKWPGGPLPDNIPHQAIDVETMADDEYELIMKDPTDFAIRKMLPRAFEALKPLAKLPPLGERARMLAMLTPIFASDEFIEMGRALVAAGQAQKRWQEAVGTSLMEEMDKICLNPVGAMRGGAGGAPLDAISDGYRAMRGTVLDMYRHPDELLALLQKISDDRVSRVVPVSPDAPGRMRRQPFALHRGTDGFLSNEQFATFYWPFFKRGLAVSIENNYIPMPFCEGAFDSRIHHFLELPKGKMVAHFDLTDMFRAKEILGGHVCIMGNVPASLLHLGTPEDVDAYCKKLIEVCGKGGGLIITHGTTLDEARPENVHAMVESARKYHPK